MEEHAWIAATLAGDTAAFAHIVRAYERAVYNLAFRMLGNREEAADAAQEGFLRAYAQLRSFDGRRSFGSWLLAIVAHHCIDLLRKRRPGRVDLGDADFQEDSAPTPEDVVLACERRSAIRGLLDRLPDGYRLVVVLRYWYDMPCEEIAQLSGQSVGGVKTRLHRARALLAKAIDSRAIENSSGTPHPSPDKEGNVSGDQPSVSGEDDRALCRSAEAPFAPPRRPLDPAVSALAGQAPVRMRLLPSL